MKFAKLFDYEDGSQILVKNDVNDEGSPEVRLFFAPEDLGICSVAFSFDDTDSGYEKCDDLFEKTTKVNALATVNELKSKIAKG